MEFRGFHVVGIATEGSAAPGGVFGVRSWLSSATQGRHVQVTNACIVQRFFQCEFVEVGVFAGSREPSDICEEGYSEGLQH